MDARFSGRCSLCLTPLSIPISRSQACSPFAHAILFCTFPHVATSRSIRRDGAHSSWSTSSSVRSSHQGSRPCSSRYRARQVFGANQHVVITRLKFSLYQRTPNFVWFATRNFTFLHGSKAKPSGGRKGPKKARGYRQEDDCSKPRANASDVANYTTVRIFGKCLLELLLLNFR